MNARTQKTRRGFTLIEVLVVITIIAVLISLLIVALASARRSAGKAAERQSVVSLKMGVEQFKNDHGFLPPMVKDVAYCKYEYSGWGAIFKSEQDPIRLRTGAPGQYDPIVFSFSTAYQNRTDRSFLRAGSIAPDERNRADYRFSEYSLPYYLMGALGAEVDGQDGPGFLSPKSNGSFSRQGSQTQPYYDIGNNTRAMVLNTTNGNSACSPSPLAGKSRFELRDRNGLSYRYYRWLPGQAIPRDGSPGELVFIQGADDLNVPVIVGDPAENTDLRDAQYAIVAAGPNRTFGDFGTEGNKDRSFVGREFVKQLVKLGPNADDDRAKTLAREDNIVEVGRR